jgi:hypothetical protein
MHRSLLAGSLVALCGVAVTACGDDTTSASTTTTTGGNTTTTTTTTSTGMAGGGGQGGTGGNATSSGGGGIGGAPTGTGGAGGNGGAAGGMGGTGGMGVGGMGVGGSASNIDQDGDGWSPADGDCCDDDAFCSDPQLVNPGAFEYLGNALDDDCDPASLDDQPVPDCTGAALDLPTSSLELIKAMDLCQFTSEAAPLPMRKWGVISNAFLTADGGVEQSPSNVQVGVLANYGSQVLPRKGATMSALSSGTARDVDDPGHIYPQNGPMAGQIGNFDGLTQTSAPPDYLAAHGGTLPSPPACPPCLGANCDQAFDSVNLKARIRVPTNALSFSYNFKFYSAEFPEFLCYDFNDFFVTLLTSSEPSIPADKNIAFDANNNPVSVNNAFFQVCFPPMGSPAGTCPAGTLELADTGMGGWGTSVKDGGGTVWLTNDSPVIPGETIELEFIIWDSGDPNVDSLVLLDRFRWNVTPSEVGVHE